MAEDRAQEFTGVIPNFHLCGVALKIFEEAQKAVHVLIVGSAFGDTADELERPEGVVAPAMKTVENPSALFGEA
jgi:hypothetical protein